jgi:poly-gamma-glutamate capsule biosynthesis protein CapA/YwtB (metallophosphatase superfamily)
MRACAIALLCCLGLLAAACDDEVQEPAGAATVPAPGTMAAAATATPSPEPEPSAEPVTTLLFTGDIIPARCTLARIEEIGDHGAPYAALRHALRAADITVGTLDATASDQGAPLGCVSTFNLAAPAATIEGIADAGFDVMSHAANHVKDCGAVACGDDAMLGTIWNLLAADVKPVGSGAALADARRPAIVERNGLRFAFLAYDDIAPHYHATETSGGAAPLDAAMMAEDIAAAREGADVVVVLPHWGEEYVAVPNARQRSFARAAAEAGADLVVGNHPHWVQGYEEIDGTFVAYALGNFVFDQDWSVETQQGALLEVTFTGTRITDTRFTPIRIHDNHQPRLAGGAEAEAILARIEEAARVLAGG